jgi:hypothetical protein
MNTLSFAWAEPTSLAAELAKPLKQVFFEFRPRGEPITLTLWRSDDTGLRIHSEMHDVAVRREVGVLSFAYNSEPRPKEELCMWRRCLDATLRCPS